MTTMRAALYERYGEPSQVLKIQRVPVPEPDAGQVRVRMLRSPMHNHDVLMVRGEYGALQTLPAIGGTEAVGVVDALGRDVEQPAVGTRVNVAGANATWAEYFVASAAAAVPLPDAIDDDIGAQLISMPASSLLALNKLGAQSGEWVVVNAANGAVGKSIVQLAAGRGIRVAGIVRRNSAKRELEALGCAAVFATDEPDWLRRIEDAMKGRVAGGVEMIGGEAAGELIGLVGNGGTVLSFGAMANAPMHVDASDLIYRELTLQGFWAKREFEQASAADLSSVVEELLELAADGDLRLPVHATFGIDDIAAAGAAYAGPREGKIMLKA